ncbi:MAG: hypothetical protein WBF35_00465, partial [Candidatus Acidiferrales bacterium]
MDNADKFRLPRAVLLLAAVICFAELASVPWHGSVINMFEPPGRDPDPLTIAIWGLCLLVRVLAAKDPPAPVVISGCFVAAVMIVASHSILKLNPFVYIPLVLLA